MFAVPKVSKIIKHPEFFIYRKRFQHGEREKKAPVPLQSL